MEQCILDVTTATFEREVIERSMQVPVVVDFWAPWCGPCRSLGPILEKLANEYGGRFVLAKVNSDDNQALAAQWGVRGIPNVKAIVNGELVDEFSGALPEGAVRSFIEALLPSPAEDLRREAAEARQRGDNPRAMELLTQARDLDPRNEDVSVDMAEILLEGGDAAAAKNILDALGEAAREVPRAASLIARAEFAARSAGLPDAATLESTIAVDPGNLDARLKLANLHVAQRRYEPALQQLLDIVQRDRGFGGDAGRKTMLSVFDMLGPDSELVREWRRRLAGALH
jgi:putative thioredoxin